LTHAYRERGAIREVDARSMYHGLAAKVENARGIAGHLIASDHETYALI
jgi:hypothetical protein